MSTLFDDVGEFHAKFRLPVFSPEKTIFGDHSLAELHQVLTYRLEFMVEELKEFTSGATALDPAAMLDALCDLAWVTLGTAHYLNLPFEAAWAEVRRSNMAKERMLVAEPGHKRGPMERITKPVGWQGPDIQGVLARHLHQRHALLQQKQNIFKGEAS